MLQSFNEHNIDFIYYKKDKWTKFLVQIQNICLDGFNISISFQSYLTYYFIAVKKVSFLQSRNFSIIKEHFCNQVTFPQSRTFATIKELFHNQGTFSRSRKLLDNQGTFTQSRNFSVVVEIFHNRKSSLKAYVLDLFNTNSYAKRFLAL